MPLPQTFNDFIPSEKLAEEYKDVWEDPTNRDYQRYLEITAIFTNSNSALIDRCNIIYKAYDHFHRHRAPEAATCIAGINNFDGRVQNGDISLIGEMRARCGSVFSAMFCHHTSPEKYYGCTRPVREVLVRLNDRDSFCNTIFSEEDLRDYSLFNGIMQILVVNYHLERVSNRDLDIMLRMNNNLN